MAKKETEYFSDGEMIKSKARVMRIIQVKEEARGGSAAEVVPEAEPFAGSERLPSEKVSAKAKKSGRGRKPKVILCRIPADVHGDLRYICFKEGKTHSELFMDAFAEYVKRHYPNIRKTDLL